MGSLLHLDRHIPASAPSSADPARPVVLRPGVPPTPAQTAQLLDSIMEDLHRFCENHRSDAVVAVADLCRFFKGVG